MALPGDHPHPKHDSDSILKLGGKLQQTFDEQSKLANKLSVPDYEDQQLFTLGSTVAIRSKDLKQAFG